MAKKVSAKDAHKTFILEMWEVVLNEVPGNHAIKLKAFATAMLIHANERDEEKDPLITEELAHIVETDGAAICKIVKPLTEAGIVQKEKRRFLEIPGITGSGLQLSRKGAMKRILNRYNLSK